MDFRDQVFLVVGEYLSITKASEQLFLSQPAVTKHIKELESKLKVTLFERKGNKLQLTPIGNTVLTHLKKIKIDYDEMYSEINKASQIINGKLIIGSSYVVSQYIVAEILPEFMKKYPDIKICMREGNAIDTNSRLHNHEIDLAILGNISQETDLKYFDFVEEEIFIVTNPSSSYANLEQINLEDIQNIPIVFQEKGTGILEVIQDFFREKNINQEKLQTCVSIGSTNAIKYFLKNFDGIAFVNENSVRNELSYNLLKRIQIKDNTIKRKLKIAIRQGYIAHNVELFIKHLLKKDLPGN